MGDNFFNNYGEEDEFGYLIPECEEAYNNGTLTEKSFTEEEFDFLINHFMGEDNSDLVFLLAEMAYRQHPYSSEMAIRYIDVLIVNKISKKALEILEKKISTDPHNPDILFLYGRALARSGEHEKAMEYVNKAFDMEGGTAEDMYMTVGQDYMEDDLFEHAIYYLEHAAKGEPKNFEVINDLAFCYDRMGEIEKSIEAYTKLIDHDPFNDYAWYNLGTIYSKVPDYEKATEAFDYSLALNPGNSSAIYNKAILCVNSGELEQATELFEDFLKIEPENTIVLVSLADAYLSVGKINEAEKNYKRALETDRTNIEANSGLAYICMFDKDYFGALVYLRRVMGDENVEYHFLVEQLNTSYDETQITEYLLYYIVALYKTGAMDKFYPNLEILLAKDQLWLDKLFEYLPKAGKDKTIARHIQKFKEGLSNQN